MGEAGEVGQEERVEGEGVLAAVVVEVQLRAVVDTQIGGQAGEEVVAEEGGQPA